MSSTGATRGVGSVGSGITQSGGSGTGNAGVAGAVGGVTSTASIARSVLFVPPVSSAGLGGAPESPLQNLRIGQLVSAKVLVTDATAGRALLLLDGQRVAAEVPDGLHEGQVVRLSVASVSAERLVLRVSDGGNPANVPTAPLDAAQVLRALDIPDTPATRAVVSALVERGQPLTRETIVALRAVVARETGQEMANARGAVDALLRGVPVTARSATLARTTGANGATSAPVGDLLRELFVALESVPPETFVTSETVARGARPATTTSQPPAEPLPTGTALPPNALASLPTLTGGETRAALLRVLTAMVARSPSADELQRVVSVLQGAPEARLAQVIADATVVAQAAATAADLGGSTAIAPSPTASPTTGLPMGPSNGVPMASSGGVLVGDTPPGSVANGGAPTGTVTVLSGGTVAGELTNGGQRNLPGATVRVDALLDTLRATNSGAPVAVPPLPLALAGVMPINIASVPAYGPDARSALGALLAMVGGTSAIEPPETGTMVTRPMPTADTATMAPATGGGRGASTPVAMLARAIHDRLEYQQLGNAATLSRGGWENSSTGSNATTGNLANPGAALRPETAPGFPANVPVPLPGDALNLSIPLAFAGQVTTLELTVWRDGGRRHDGQEESSGGLHAQMRLDLEQLGRVGADIRISGTNLRCRLTADTAATNELLRAHGEALLERLRTVGFTVEGVEYRASAGLPPAPYVRGPVVRRVDMGV